MLVSIEKERAAMEAKGLYHYVWLTPEEVDTLLASQIRVERMHGDEISLHPKLIKKYMAMGKQA